MLKEKMANQLFKEKYWEMLPFALQLYSNEYETVREIVRYKIEKQSAYLYSRITKQEADLIRAILHEEKYGIPEKLQKKIEFDLKFVVK